MNEQSRSSSLNTDTILKACHAFMGSLYMLTTMQKKKKKDLLCTIEIHVEIAHCRRST